MHVDGFASGWRAVLLLIVFSLVTCTVLAEEGVLVLVVTDPEQHPFANVRIGAAGDGGSPQFTDQNGKARLRLAPNTKPAAWVTLQLAGGPDGLDLAFISPYDGRIRVPPFDNEQDNYDPVVLVKHSDKAVLESGSGMLAIHATVSHAVAAKKKPAAKPPATRSNQVSPGEYGRPRLLTVGLSTATSPAASPPAAPTNEELQDAALAVAAQKFGLPVADVKAAIADWGGDPLIWKLILLTATIEDGGTDPFPSIRATEKDVYFGAGSWSLGECSLQPLLLKFQKRDEKRFAEIIGPDAAWLSKTIRGPCAASSPAILKRVVDDSGRLRPKWRDRFRKLGYDRSFQRVQVSQMTPWMSRAQNTANALGFHSEQALAFCYDVTQAQGSTSILQQRRNMLNDVVAFQQQTGRAPDEQERLQMLGNDLIQRDQPGGRRPMLTDSLTARATLLSQGQAVIQGTHYDLADFRIGMQDAQTGVDLPLNNDVTARRQLQDGWIPSQGPPPQSASLPDAAPARALLTSAEEPLGPFDPAVEEQFVDLINQERAKHRLPPLTVNLRLTHAARKHTQMLAAHGSLSHQFEGEPPLDVRYANENLTSDQIGENTALDQNVPSAHKGLMDDPPHRDNILNPNYNAVGVAVIRSGGRLYVTEDFARLAK